MTFDNILKTYGTESRKLILNDALKLGHKLYGKPNWVFNHSYDSETLTSISGNKCNISIGEKALYDDCNDSECNRAAYVLLIKDMYHEYRHVWHDTTAWNDKAGLNSIASYRQTTDMVRRKFVREYFPSIYENNYSNDPSEMDAEWYGIKMTLTYFESNPIISKPEAEDMLYQLMMADGCVHREMLDQYKDRLGSIHDVLEVFDERRKTAASIPYSVAEDDFLNAGVSKEYRETFDKCKTGIEQDKVLEQAILAVRPENIRKAPLRLRDELVSCMRQMKLDTPGNVPHAVPPKRISYSVPNTSETIEFTEEDVASVSVQGQTCRDISL